MWRKENVSFTNSFSHMTRLAALPNEVHRERKAGKKKFQKIGMDGGWLSNKWEYIKGKS